MSGAPQALLEAADRDDDIEPSWLAPTLAALFAKPLFYQIVELYDNPSADATLDGWARDTLVRIMSTVASADAISEERVPYAIAELKRYADEVYESKLAFERARKRFQVELELALGSRRPQLLRDLTPFSSHLDNFFERGSPAQLWLSSATEELFGTGVFDVSSDVAINKGSLQRIGARLEQMKEEGAEGEEEGESEGESEGEGEGEDEEESEDAEESEEESGSGSASSSGGASDSDESGEEASGEEASESKRQKRQKR